MKGSVLTEGRAKPPASSSEMCVISALDFFRRLYAGCSGYIELRPVPVPARTQGWGLSVTDGELETGDSDTLRHFVNQCAANEEHAFFGVALRQDVTSGGANNLAVLPALYLDFDDVTASRRENIHVKFRSGPAPSIVINSGGGLHCYWLLEEPMIAATPDGLQAIKNALGRLGAYFDGVIDPSCLEPARVLRIPGTVNPKYDPPRRVVVESVTDMRYVLTDLLSWCPAEPLKQSRRRSLRVGNTAGVDHDAFARLRTAYLRRLEPADMFGLDLTVGDARHATAVSLAGLLHDGERDEIELVTILEALWDEYSSREANPGEIDNIVRDVMRRTPAVLLPQAQWEREQRVATLPPHLRHSNLAKALRVRRRTNR